jgi:hypothetical protein
MRAPHWAPTRSRDVAALRCWVNPQEHTRMVDLGADGDPGTC